MRLPRYITARSTTAELRSAVAADITPEEAARYQLVKYGSIASVAGSLAEVSNTLADMQAEEEYTSAVSQFENSMLSIDSALENKPYQYDDNGRIVTDTSNIAADELEARKAVAGDVRGTISSGRARRDFDKYLDQVSQKRNAFYQAKAVERETKIMSMRLENDVTTMLDSGNYDGARDRLKQGMANGVVDPLMFAKASKEVDHREVTDQVYAVLNAPLEDVDTNQINAVLDKLQGDDFDLLEGKEKYVYIHQLNTMLANLDQNLSELNAEQQRAIFYDLFAKAKRGQLSLAELRDSGLTDNSYEGRLLTMITGDEGDISNPAKVNAYSDALRSLQLPLEGDWGASANALRDQILMDDSLSGADADKLIGKIDNMEKGIFSDPLYQNLTRQAYQMVTGFEEGILGQITSQLQSQYKVTTEVAREFQQQLIRKAEQLGPRRMDDLDKWVEDAAQGFRVMASQKNLQKIGVTAPVPKDGILTEDYRMQVNNQIKDWYFTNYTNDPQGTMEIAGSTIAEVERLTGWKLDVPANGN